MSAANFNYIGASDLIREVRAYADLTANVIHFVAFVAGVALMLVMKLALEP